MTSPLDYQGSRMFPQDILNGLDRRLKALEAERTAKAARQSVPEEIKITCEHDDRIELVEIVDAKRIDGTLHIAIRIDALAQPCGEDAANGARGERQALYTNVLFGRVTEWVNAHGIPFEAQNELFCILATALTLGE